MYFKRHSSNLAEENASQIWHVSASKDNFFIFNLFWEKTLGGLFQKMKNGPAEMVVYSSYLSALQLSVWLLE